MGRVRIRKKATTTIWNRKAIFSLGAIVFILGVLMGSCSAIRYFGGVPEHVKQTEIGTKHIKGQPPGLVHYRDTIFVYGGVGLVGVILMIGSRFKKDT